MRAALVIMSVLAPLVARADDLPRTTPYGFDHLLHQRNIDVKGMEPLACMRCHVEQKGTGALVGKPGHGACFGACHDKPPVAPKRGSKLAYGDRVKVCTSCHSPAADGAPYTGKLPVAYPPYGLDPDFNIVLGHKQHGTIACTHCHDMREKPVPRAAHDRCSACHDGSGAAGRGPAMTKCLGCHPQAVGKPEPPQLAVVHDTVSATFSHTKHGARSAAGKDCTTCHAAIKDTDDTQLPRPTMQSCGVSACHDGKAGFAATGPCTRCHTEAPPRYEVFRTNNRFLHSGDHAGVVAERPCSACHALSRGGNPTTAGHDACVQCHAADFARRKPEKCSACHNASEPWRHLVADRPLPDRTEFGVMLDHDKHPQDCARCHTLRTSARDLRPPRGHVACTGDACHAAGRGPVPTLDTCSGCHRAALVDAREQARLNAPWSVRASFQHATHTRAPDGAELACRACHTKLSGNDLVALATPAKATCLPCHDTGKTAFSLTGTTCSRCHPSANKAAAR